MSCLVKTVNEAGPPKRSVIESALGRHVRRIREAIGWTQAQLSDALGREGVKMTSGQVAKFERGERPINFAELSAMAEALRVPLPRLVDLREWSQDEALEVINEVEWTRLVADIERNEQERRELERKLADVKHVRARMIERQKEEASGGGQDD